MAADVERAVNNPFRSLQVTPNPTGTGPSTSSVESPSPQLPRVQSHSSSQPQPEPDSRQAMTPPSTSDNVRERDSSPLPRNRRSADDLADELQSTTLEELETPSEPPPAYTPSANPYEGEATVEYGPHRPFQPAPPPPPLPQHFTGMSGMSSSPLRPQYSGIPAHRSSSPYMTPQATGTPIMPNRTGGWTSYPGQGAPSSSSLGQYGPPPRHPQLTGNGTGYVAPASVSSPQIRISPPAPTGNDGLSEFARDFYASSPVDPRVPSSSSSNASSDDAAGPEHFERVGPEASSSSAPTSTYAPPPGAPPSIRPSTSSPSSPSYAPPAGPPPPPSRASSNFADDLKPTTTPTSGRPLLNKGRTLVYPIGYECKKCLNTGYKQFDPSHPCRKCWEKYSKPYSGAIMYAPRTVQSQRPLPNLKPPHLGHRPSQSQSHPQSQFQPPILASSSSSGPGLFRSQSACRPPGSPWQGRTGSGFGSGLGLGHGRFMSPQQPIGMPSPQVNVTYGRPPPGSVVLRPGDPRIGGRLCWRCDGSGTVSFLIFDVEECPVCRGAGRVFQ